MAYIRTVAGSGGTVSVDTKNRFTATTEEQHKEPEQGKMFADVYIEPQQHSEIYVPPAISNSNDMGAVHNYRYVDTSSFKKPSGQYTPTPVAYSANNTYGPYDVTNYKTFYFQTSVSVPKVATGSFTLTTSARTLECGFEPNFISCCSAKPYAVIYDYRKSTTKYAFHWYTTDGSSSGTPSRRTNATLGGESIPAALKSITSNGFVMYGGSGKADMKNMVVYWVAMRI